MSKFKSMGKNDRRKFLIEGNYPLFGKVKIRGAKNASFKLMIASLLTKQESLISNVPQIIDTSETKEIIENLGGKVKREGPHLLRISPFSLSSFIIPSLADQKSRASLLFIGPLLSRFGQAILPVPGGDKIGRRPIDRHLEGLRALGVKIEFKNNSFLVSASKLKGATYRFPQNTHTGTETLILVATVSAGTTILENAAQEPEVDDLISFLNKMGADIKRIAPRRIKIIGGRNLKGANHKVMSDRNEAVTFACAALVTKGDILVENARQEHLTAFLEKLKEIGGGYEKRQEGLRFYYRGPLGATKVTTAAYPGFMTDWQALWTVLMTQAKGESIVQETIFENRFGYVKDLIKMGAKITLFNPQVENPEEFYNFRQKDDKPEYFHAAKIVGTSPLVAREMKVGDIRSGATLTLAALTAKGQSTLSSIEHIDRGYEKLEERLKSLGAKIKRVEK